MKYSRFLALIVFSLFIGLSSCSNDDDNVTPEVVLTPSQILGSTAWITTTVKDQAGVVIPNDDSRAAGYVGYAYYRADGTFAIYSLNDEFRISGYWSVSPDGKTRILTVNRNATGSIPVFVRTVSNITLTQNLYTYRITDANGTFDVSHEPTKHAEVIAQ